jgi:hypothetical protein
MLGAAALQSCRAAGEQSSACMPGLAWLPPARRCLPPHLSGPCVSSSPLFSLSVSPSGMPREAMSSDSGSSIMRAAPCSLICSGLGGLHALASSSSSCADALSRLLSPAPLLPWKAQAAGEGPAAAGCAGSDHSRPELACEACEWAMPPRGVLSERQCGGAAAGGACMITWHVDSTQLSRRRASRADRILLVPWLRLGSGAGAVQQAPGGQARCRSGSRGALAGCEGCRMSDGPMGDGRANMMAARWRGRRPRGLWCRATLARGPLVARRGAHGASGRGPETNKALDRGRASQSSQSPTPTPRTRAPSRSPREGLWAIAGSGPQPRGPLYSATGLRVHKRPPVPAARRSGAAECAARHQRVACWCRCAPGSSRARCAAAQRTPWGAWWSCGCPGPRQAALNAPNPRLRWPQTGVLSHGAEAYSGEAASRDASLIPR